MTSPWLRQYKMGIKQSLFDSETLNLYQECTFFTGTQIKHLYKRFSALNPGKIDPSKADVKTRLGFTEVMSLPELRENPFRLRICEVFASGGRGIGFEDFLDLCSVFSDDAPWDLKAAYAFRLYDFNGDAYLCQDDLAETLICITGDGLTNTEITTIAESLLKEADIDQDGKLSYTEFEHVISRAPDFVNLFRMSLT